MGYNETLMIFEALVIEQGMTRLEVLEAKGYPEYIKALIKLFYELHLNYGEISVLLKKKKTMVFNILNCDNETTVMERYIYDCVKRRFIALKQEYVYFSDKTDVT